MGGGAAGSAGGGGSGVSVAVGSGTGVSVATGSGVGGSASTGSRVGVSMDETTTGVSVAAGRVTIATWTGLVAVKVGSGVRVACKLSSVPAEKREVKPQPRLRTNNKLLKKSHKRR